MSIQYEFCTLAIDGQDWSRSVSVNLNFVYQNQKRKRYIFTLGFYAFKSVLFAIPVVYSLIKVYITGTLQIILLCYAVTQ